MADFKSNRNVFLLNDHLDLGVKPKSSSASCSPYTPLRVVYELINLIFFTIYIYSALIISYVFPAEPKNLSSEVILVTGGSTGIGRELCLQLAEIERNLTLVIWDTDEQANIRVLKQLKTAGVEKAYAFLVDVGSRKQVEAAAKTLKKEIGNVTMLFNLAKCYKDTGFSWEMNPDSVDAIFQNNLMPYYWLLREFLPFMIDHGYGHIIGTSTPVGFNWGRALTSFTASKCAVSGFFESVKEDVRHLPARPNIQFSLVYSRLLTERHLGEKRYSFLRRSMSPSLAASKIIRGIRQNDEHVYAPGLARFESLLTSILPPPIIRRIADLLELYQV